MSRNPFAAILRQAQEPGTPSAGWQAAATLYHAYLTGLILLLANRRGAADVGEWSFRLFRRQHLAKFTSSFAKLGLHGLPDAVAAARYHYLANAIGGVEVTYHEESAHKAWVHFRHPRWLYAGAAVCGVPVEVSHGFLRGWYGHNGNSMGNPRLGFVCTSQDMTGQYGLAGYFFEYGHDLAEEERLQFSDEPIPAFDPAGVPGLDAAEWPPERLHKANRNYAMDYIANGLPELVDQIGAANAAELGRLAGHLIGAQFFTEVAERLGLGEGPTAAHSFAAFMTALAQAQDDAAEWSADGDAALVHQSSWRLMRGQSPDPAVFAAWNGLWPGALAAYDPRLELDVLGRLDRGDEAFEWRVGVRQ
ncbi:MAG: hypothetical protein QF398_02780 [Alphaproteobacteria bacterium]|nr:hypothetical protein [Alphaproteobacteria bacterium]